MTLLQLDLLPLRPAVRADGPTTVDVLLRIVPPTAEGGPKRPPLNLGLVLDRSGSMGGDKIRFARQAAVFAVQQLLPEDRVSVTVFDDQVNTLAPSAPATDKARLIDLISRVHPGNSTALHAAWQEGARQVRAHHDKGRLNRVLLLTDGLANVGETNADNICTDVKRQAVEGVGTTAMGVGADYNEDLLEAMARSGDGNYYFIEAPDQLTAIYRAELSELLANVGKRVALRLEPLAGATVGEVVNDLERDPDGRWLLPNLIAGMPVEVVVRLEVPAGANGELCRFHVTWEASDGRPEAQTTTLVLPAVPGDAWQALAPDLAVQERIAVQRAGRLKRQATRHLERREREEALRCLAEARRLFEGLPRSAVVEQEERDLNDVRERIERGDDLMAQKMGKYQHYRRSLSKPTE